MKLKFQQGGTFVPPFATYQPLAIPTQQENTTKSSKKSSSDDGDFDMEDIYALLKDLKGLPIDNQAARNKITSLISSIETKLNTQDPFTATTSIASEYVQLLNLVDQINFNRTRFDAAAQRAEINGSLFEYTVNQAGQVLVSSEDGYDWVTPEEFKNNSDKYTPITNNQLLNLRANTSADLAFDTNSIDIVAGSISIKQVEDFIQKAIANLGETLSSESGYVESSKLISGLQDYIKAKETAGNAKATIQDLYKGKILNKSQATQAQQALNYIYRTLPKNAIALLQMYSEEKTPEGAKKLIDSLVTSKLDVTFELDSIEKVDDGLGSIKNTPVISMLTGMGTTRKISINTGTSVTNDVIGRESVLTRGSEKLGEGDTLADVSTSDFAANLPIEQATFGGIKINPNSANLFMLDTSKFVVMDLPVDQEAKRNGIIRPDLDLYRRIEEAETEIAALNNPTDEQKNIIYVKHKLPENIKKSDGTYDTDLIPHERFARITGILDSKALPEDVKPDNTVIEIEDDNLIENITSKFEAINSKYKFSGGLFGDDTLYQGAVYIPVDEDYNAGLMGSGQYLKMPDVIKLHNIQQREIRDEQQADKIKTYQKPQI